jgi:hypothetical protein
MKMKASPYTPEIWFASEDESAAEAKYQALLEGGLNVAFTDTRILAAIPARAVVREFEQRRGCISWTVDKESLATPYQAHAIIVYSKPKAPLQPQQSSSVVLKQGKAKATEETIVMPSWFQNPACLDVFFGFEDTVQRFFVAQGTMSFAALGERKRKTFGENCEAFARVIQELFDGTREDGRLMDFAPRKPVIPTVGAQKVLDAISPKGPLDLIDLSARLIFLTSRWTSSPEKARVKETESTT